LVLLPERAVFWPKRRSILIADLHLGKEAAFRSAGIPLPTGDTADTLQRLGSLIAATDARRVVILGDLFHAATGMTPETLQALAAWRKQHSNVDVLHIRGNHDRSAGWAAPELGFDERDEAVVEAPFVLRHEPVEDDQGMVIGGHIHPGIVLRGRARDRLRLPCFVVGPRRMILPAFGTFTGLFTVLPAVGEKVYVVAESSVLPVR
jgi:uncharacterized protein